MTQKTPSFICYRRADTAASAGRVFDWLSRNSETIDVFLDVEDILPGDDFERAIEERLSTIAVLFVLIGRGWLSAAAPDGSRRLDDPRDFVHAEISAALKLGVRVVPVLVDGGQMPAAHDLPGPLKRLAARNAFVLRHDRFHSDMRELERLVAGAQAVKTPNPDAVVAPGVIAALSASFQQLIDARNPSLFLVASNADGQFVQFTDVTEGSVEVDLPTHPLKPRQLLAAQHLFMESYGATVATLEGTEHFAFKFRAPATAEYLTLLTLEVFERVYSAPPTVPLSVKIDAF